MEQHNEGVKVIAERVRHFHSKQESFRIYHGSTNSTRSANFDRDHVVDTSKLNNILSIDTQLMTALVEPNVPLDQLLDATLARNFMPPVVMEFPGITVGGGFSGTSAESSSFKYGLFEQTIVSIEIVLADGRVLKASSGENPDLLAGAAGGFGTLGVLTLLEIKLIPAQPYVELTYIPVSSIDQAVDVIDGLVSDPEHTDFVDGILYSSTFGVIVKGCLTSSKPERTVRFTRRADPWFYLHARSLFSFHTHRSSPPSPVTETVPLKDYLFRYDRGGFWTALLAFRYFFVPFNRVTRFLLDSYLHTRPMFHALHASGLAHKYIAQDVCVPKASARALFDFTDGELGGVYPLWLCPLPRPDKATIAGIPHAHGIAMTSHDGHGAGGETGWTLNFGVWGPMAGRDQSFDAFIAVNRRFEKRVRELGGVKTLYAHSYYTEEEFNEIYDRASYDALRVKYGAGGLPSVYDKVSVKDEEARRAFHGIKRIRPIGGLVGVLDLVLGRDYLLKKRK